MDISTVLPNCYLVSAFLVTFPFHLVFSQSLNVDESCYPQHVMTCVEELHKKYSSEDGPVIMKNAEELDAFCGHQEKAFACITDFVLRCLPPDHQRDFFNSTKDSQDLMMAFCKEGYERITYLKHLDCFNREALQVHNCMQIYHDVKMIEKVPIEREQSVLPACCHMHNAMDCSRTVIRSCCPIEAADLFDVMIANVTRQFLKFLHCNTFGIDMRECSKVSISYFRGCTAEDVPGALNLIQDQTPASNITIQGNTASSSSSYSFLILGTVLYISISRIIN